MPQLKFGKYKGCDINNVPTDYLQWLARESRAGRWSRSTRNYSRVVSCSRPLRT
jgi:hypothetical protein